MYVKSAFAAQVIRCAIVLFALSWLGCDRESGEPDWDHIPLGAWFAGDFHVHSSVGSNDTDGDSFPEIIKETALNRGLAFVVITDHSNSAGSGVDSQTERHELWNQGPEFPLWETAAALSDAEFLMINGSEISPVSFLEPAMCPGCPTIGDGPAPVGHVGCFPRDLADFDRSRAFVDRPPGQVTGASSIDQCRFINGFAVVNHPVQELAEWISYDWTGYHYDAVEVWNGGMAFDPSDTSAWNSYLCDRLAGRKPVAIGGSDNHRVHIPYEGLVTLHPPLGFPKTSIFADTLSWSAIMASLEKGRVVIHDDGAFVDFRVFDTQGRYVAGIGDTIRRTQLRGNQAELLVRGESRLEQELQFVHVAPGSCTDNRRAHKATGAEVASSVVKNTLVCRDKAPCTFELRLSVELAAGLYYMTVGVPSGEYSQRDLAFTNVLTVE